MALRFHGSSVLSILLLNPHHATIPPLLSLASYSTKTRASGVERGRSQTSTAFITVLASGACDGELDEGQRVSVTWGQTHMSALLTNSYPLGSYSECGLFFYHCLFVRGQQEGEQERQGEQHLVIVSRASLCMPNCPS